ncbi:MAG: 50S ribosomal protein L11 methyltransferase [Deltaproteobacteria bacterium]
MKKRKRARNEGWTGRVRSVDVGERLRLVPYWEQSLAASDRINVIIDPGPSFGSGDHPSTLMALELLERAVKKLSGRIPSPSLVDAGTGTGVLSIAGKALGCGFTVGFDIDAAAVYAARRNLGLNGMARDGRAPHHSVDLLVGGANSIKGSFDIVAANLAAPTLIRLSRSLSELVGTFLILSGIAKVMEDAVVTAYQAAHLNLVAQEEKDGWSAALFRRGEVTHKAWP